MSARVDLASPASQQIQQFVSADDSARWNNRRMPTPDEHTVDDGADPEERPPAQPTVPVEPVSDDDPTTSPPEPAAPDSVEREVRTRSAEEDEPSPESEMTREADTSSGGTSHKRVVPSADMGEQMLALERRRDDAANIDTRPPVGETVTFRSFTVAEIYAGQTVGSLTAALAAVDWRNSDEPALDRVAEARKGYQYYRRFFWLLPEAPQVLIGGYGVTSLPAGIAYVFGEYDVLGPSLMAAVLTFVLDDDEATKIEAALRDDAESRLAILGP